MCHWNKKKWGFLLLIRLVIYFEEFVSVLDINENNSQMIDPYIKQTLDENGGT